DDGFVTLWDLASGSQIAAAQYPGQIHALTFSSDGTLLAGDYESPRLGDHSVRIWLIPSLTEMPELTRTTYNRLTTMAFSIDGKYFAGATGQVPLGGKGGRGLSIYPLGPGRVEIWRVSDGSPVTSLPHDTDVIALAFPAETNEDDTADRIRVSTVNM